MAYKDKLPLKVGFNQEEKIKIRNFAIQYKISQAELVRRIVSYMFSNANLPLLAVLLKSNKIKANFEVK